MTKDDRTIIWLLFWLLILTSGDPDLLDKVKDLLDALIAMIGGK